MDTMKRVNHTFSDDIGDAAVTVYNIFPGVQLAYYSVHMEQLELDFSSCGNLIEIHHCREGRIEQQSEDEYFYLMPGDLSIAKRTEMVQTWHFPTRHYHGIAIGINMDLVSEQFLQLIDEIGVQPLEVADRLCGDRHCFILRSEKYIEHIFSELYSVPEQIKFGYFKVKILELFLMLSGKNRQENRILSGTLSGAQVQLAHQAAAYLAERLDQRITIAELARKFNVSDTYLKNSFKSVYGVPVYSYVRIQKIQAAAQRIIHTEESVMVIAYEFGYSNTSKFAAAFQKIMGETPGEYRKAHRKNHYSVSE